MHSKKLFFKSGITLVVSLLFFVSGSAQIHVPMTRGIWRGILLLNDSAQLPFNFELKSNTDYPYVIEIMNGQERIEVTDVNFIGDSVFIKMPVFDSEFRCKNFGDSLKGVWINNARKNKNVIPFTAEIARAEPVLSISYIPAFNGAKWECDFSPKSKDVAKAIGIFEEVTSSYITGTFLTETGDYRYLSGFAKRNESFYLSCFDGAHAFLFTGKIKGDSIVNGNFYSGSHWHETWVAKRNDKFQLRNPDSLTFLKPGFTKVDFNFKNLEGKNVSLKDDKFKNKVVLIQIMGSWCPNCMDETKFLASFYDTYKSKGLEVVGLAFERTDDFNKAVANVSRMKNKFNANYEFLITGKTGADQASEALPMLNKIMAFPTTIYIDKKGIVRKIYTGFYGPATGDNYTKYVEETTRFIEKLLAE